MIDGSVRQNQPDRSPLENQERHLCRMQALCQVFFPDPTPPLPYAHPEDIGCFAILRIDAFSALRKRCKRERGLPVTVLAPEGELAPGKDILAFFSLPIRHDGAAVTSR